MSVRDHLGIVGCLMLPIIIVVSFCVTAYSWITGKLEDLDYEDEYE